MKKILIVLLLHCTAMSCINAQQTNSPSPEVNLSGQVFDSTMNEPLLGATIKVFQSNKFIKGMATNIDGEFRFALPTGTYDVEVSFSGFTTQRIIGIILKDGALEHINITLSDTFIYIELCCGCCLYRPMISFDPENQGQTIWQSSAVLKRSTMWE